MDWNCKGQHCLLYHVHHYSRNYLLTQFFSLLHFFISGFMELSRSIVSKIPRNCFVSSLDQSLLTQNANHCYICYLICPNVIFTVQPETIRKRFDFQEVQKNSNWYKFAEITMSTDFVISHTENTLHLLCSLDVPRQYTLERQSSPSGFPSC